MADQNDLIIVGARQNNLKNISLRIPHDQVTVITGVSGSGKSSLAFDTIFAEGQWRYIESLSTYARMFLEKLDRPDVDLFAAPLFAGLVVFDAGVFVVHPAVGNVDLREVKVVHRRPVLRLARQKPDFNAIDEPMFSFLLDHRLSLV